MEPIVNPVVFYFLSIADSIRNTILAITILLGAGTFAFTLFTLLDEGFDLFKKYIKKLVILLGIGLILYIGIPSSTTLTKMIVASYITPNNITSVEETVDHTIDYIIEKVDMITSKDKDK